MSGVNRRRSGESWGSRMSKLQTTFNDSTSERGVLVFGMSGDKAYESSLDNLSRIS